MIDFENIKEVLGDFSVSSAIDVLVLAIVIFSTFRLLSGTRAMTPLRGGLALVLIAVLLGRVFDLTVVNFIVENGLTVLIVAAVVVFQPELRRGLDRLGRTSLRDWLDQPETFSNVDAVAAAAGLLSRERHGGLIVFERETGLQDVIDTGIAVDAKITPELLAGIFFPNSPLHDMAVVIREDRVVAARCELPLAAELPGDSSRLGTRHRAAIGITEQTDALTVVVSEETGDISVARAGKLTHVNDESGLRAILNRIFNAYASGRLRPAAATRTGN